MQWVKFEINGEQYAIDVMIVQEVLRVTNLHPSPNDNEIGLINLRGNVIGILDIGQILGIEVGELNDSSRIIIVDLGSKVSGFISDGALEIINERKSEIQEHITIVDLNEKETA